MLASELTTRHRGVAEENRHTCTVVDRCTSINDKIQKYEQVSTVKITTDSRVQLTHGLNVSLNMKYIFGKPQFTEDAKKIKH